MDEKMERVEQMKKIKRGQIYYVDLGVGQGSELKKIRPCVVIQNDIGNRYSPTTIIAPITHRTTNKQQPTQVILSDEIQKGNSDYLDGVIMAEQIRIIDKDRIKELAGTLLPSGLALLDKAMKISIGIK